LLDEAGGTPHPEGQEDSKLEDGKDEKRVVKQRP